MRATKIYRRHISSNAQTPVTKIHESKVAPPEYLDSVFYTQIKVKSSDTRCGIKEIKRGDNLTGGDRFSALFSMLQ